MKKNLLVTGGSNGIGRETVYQAAKLGYRVFFTYFKSRAKALKIKEKIDTSGGECFCIKVNLNSEKDIKKLFNFIKKKSGSLDYLVNNAGLKVSRKKFKNLKMSLIKKSYDINVFSIYNCILKAVKIMRKGPSWKCIVNITSTAAKFGGINLSHYAPAKAAIENLTLGLSKELSNQKIRVVNISPGIISSGKKTKKNYFEKKNILNSIPNKRLGKPLDVAKSILWVISDEANYVNGTTITVSGGR